MASRPAASRPAATASRRRAYSAGSIRGSSLTGALFTARRLVGGKLPHRVRDLLGVGHEELLLRAVEGHRRYVGCRDAHDRPVQVVEGVLGDDRGDLGPEAPCEVVLVDDHRLAGAPDRLEDRLAVEGRQGPQVEYLD